MQDNLYNYDELERNHHYIQWLFPTDFASQHNPHARAMTREELDMLVNDQDTEDTLLNSFRMMLNFYGMEINGDGVNPSEVRRGANFNARVRNMIKLGFYLLLLFVCLVQINIS